MARTLRNRKIDSRSARSRLSRGKEVYWVSISKGCAIGYRRGKKFGVWVAKYVRDDFRRETTLGPADDILDADGITALDFSQAQEKARSWYTTTSRAAAGHDIPIGRYTVEDVVTDYMKWFRVERKGVATAQYIIDAHVLPKLGASEVDKLTTRLIREWHHELAATPPRVRGKPGHPQKYRDISTDPDSARKRRATANRALVVLRAALNRAWQEGKVPTDNVWRRVKPFRETEASRVRYLTLDECSRLIYAETSDFQPLIKAGLLTGCRYGELCQIHVGDFNPDAGTLLIQQSKSGKPRHVVLSAEGSDFFHSLVSGRHPSEPMLLRADDTVWKRGQQTRRMRNACERARIDPVIGFHVLRHTYASHLVMNGADILVVAKNLGHSDTRMVQKHYAHLSSSYIADTIRDLAPQFGLSASIENVVNLDDAKVPNTRNARQV